MASNPASDLVAHLRTFADVVREAYDTPVGVDAWPEDRLKAPVGALVQAAGAALSAGAVRTYPETRAEGIGRPDLGVTVDALLAGHVELKKPGTGADAPRFKGRDGQQWKKFADLPNVVYTDGREWALYRRGERTGPLVRLAADPAEAGAEGITDADARALADLFRAFLGWAPQVPRRPRALAELLAPVCRLMRHDVEESLAQAGSPLAALARDWRQFFIADADDREFADAYAQTLTYALLLARFSGGDDLSVSGAARTLRDRHNLLAEALAILGDQRAQDALGSTVDLLRRIVGAVDPATFERQGEMVEDGPAHAADPWLYFYEDFLAAYDPKLRNNRGVYYTPWQVVQAQVRTTAALLADAFGAHDGFASEGVTLLDPACGTGTYLLTAVRHGIDAATARRGPGAAASAATRLAQNSHAFELLVGPYAVARLRLTQQIAAAGGALPADGAHVYLTNTLASPFENDPDRYLPLLYTPLSDEHARAQAVKRDAPILVCIGNPPYDREQAEAGEAIGTRKGAWVRHGDEVQKGQRSRPILQDFVEPLAATGDGLHAKNLYNDYVYFWRWALWKVAEQPPGHGVVSFITASSYLRGPGFRGMRRVMREAFDEVWILDLGGDNLGARKSDNVFAIQTPVCIATGVRYRADDARRTDGPARVRYARLADGRAEKLEQLRTLETIAGVDWTDAADGPDAPFLPARSETFVSFPAVTDVFPWQDSGMQFKRRWPIAEDRDTLERRWRALLAADDRADALKESRDLKLDRTYPRLDGSDERDPAIADLPPDAPVPEPTRIAYRSFNRMWALADNRLGDYLRPTLWAAHGGQQTYLVGFLTNVPGEGPLAVATDLVPDLDSFRGSFGGKHVIPLWRDAAGTEANVSAGVLAALAAAHGARPAPADVFAYAFALLAAPSYVARFWEALETPGPRLPLTADAALFAETAALGRELLWLHTYGERFAPAGTPPGAAGLPAGSARLARATPPDRYPDAWSYDDATREIRIGEGDAAGVLTGVPPEVMAFSLSGFRPVKSWLDYRMASGAGKTSSPLDDLRPRTWTFDAELQDLLWVLETVVARQPAADALLDRVVGGPLVAAAGITPPTAAERTGPSGRTRKTAPPSLFDDPAKPGGAG